MCSLLFEELILEIERIKHHQIVSYWSQRGRDFKPSSVIYSINPGKMFTAAARLNVSGPFMFSTFSLAESEKKAESVEEMEFTGDSQHFSESTANARKSIPSNGLWLNGCYGNASSMVSATWCGVENCVHFP